MSANANEDGVYEEWILTWFAPDGDKQYRTPDEDKARKKATREGVAEWNPLLEHRITRVTVETMLVTL